jgi:hypothetical protein
MKKYIICFLILSFLTSCTNQPKCDSDEAIQLAKDLIKQELKSDGGTLGLAMFGMGDEKTIDEFVDNNIELKSVRTTEKDDELKTCSCASQITFKFSDDFKEKMKESGKENIILSAINDILNKQIEYNYNLQIIEKEKNLYIEGIVPKEELMGVLTNYILFTPKEKTNESEDNNKNLDTNENLNEKEVSEKSNINNVSDLNSLLLKQLRNPEIVDSNKKCEDDKYCNLVYEWSELYYSLPDKCQKNIKTNSGTYEVVINDFNGLWKGFYYISKNENMNKISDIITDKIAYNDEPVTFRASMVYFYVKYQLLNEKE